VRGPDIHPAAEHPGASDHIVHFCTPRASIVIELIKPSAARARLENYLCSGIILPGFGGGEHR
jgi:hypothetical protein